MTAIQKLRLRSQKTRSFGCVKQLSNFTSPSPANYSILSAYPSDRWTLEIDLGKRRPGPVKRWPHLEELISQDPSWKRCAVVGSTSSIGGFGNPSESDLDSGTHRASLYFAPTWQRIYLCCSTLS